MTTTPEDLAALRYLNDIANRYCRPARTLHAPPRPSRKGIAMTRSPEDVPADAQQPSGTGRTGAPDAAPLRPGDPLYRALEFIDRAYEAAEAIHARIEAERATTQAPPPPPSGAERTSTDGAARRDEADDTPTS